jgi:YidC/Oxa1 family membrane protein insertase
MERRVFLAILLSFIVFYGYQTLFLPPPQEPTRTTPAATAPEPATPSTGGTAPGAAAPAASIPVGASDPAPVTAESAEREIVVETTTVQAVFSNRGGRLLHWRLKAYRDSTGEPLDLVPSGIPDVQPRPFSLRVADESVTRRLNGGLYRVSGDAGGRVDATSGAATLTFEYADAGGLTARKDFRFDPSTYVVTFSAAVTSGGQTLNPAVLWGPGLGDAGASSGGGSFFTGNYVQPPQALFHRGGEVERLDQTLLAGAPAHEGDFRFAGVDDHYFLAAVINPGYARLELYPLTVAGEEGTQRQFLTHSVRRREPPRDLRFFIGPKQVDILRSVDTELVRAINYGMFDFMVVPLLSSLKWLHQYFGNYGIAIIVLTILINLAMFPLRHKSVVSMRKGQEVQPQIKAIQDRYAHLKMTDPGRQKMQTEIMAVYREKGFNPAAGCVPMLLTMPVLLAFYSLLSMSVELRGQPFGGWIQDLSAADPFYIIPALMGVTMFWQQKITPSSMDPAQQRVMMIMPVMFTGMMLFSPSGVVLYWFVSNLWAIGQQYFTNWLLGPPVIGRPPAERKVKNAGRGKTAAAEKS